MDCTVVYKAQPFPTLPAVAEASGQELPHQVAPT